MAPNNHPIETEHHLPNLHSFWVPAVNFSFRLLRKRWWRRERARWKRRKNRDPEVSIWFNLCGKWSTPWRSLGKFGNFGELLEFEIWIRWSFWCQSALFLWKDGPRAEYRRLTRLEVCRVWEVRGDLAEKNKVKDVSCFVSPCSEMILRYCMFFAHFYMWPVLSLWTVTGWS